MHKKIIAIALLTNSLSLHAGTIIIPENPAKPENPFRSWFAAIGTGYSWTKTPGIVNPNPAQWDFSQQGYDSPLGNRPFYTFEIGKKVHPYFDISINYIYNQQFNYQKFQTGTSATPDFTGNARHRFFNLNNQALFLNAFVHPAEPSFAIANIGVTPFAGLGIGYSRSSMSNFHTVSTVNINGNLIGSTSTIGPDTNSDAFAWQGSVGLNITPDNSPLSVDIGYRYFDGGKFKGPNTVFTGAIFQDATPWTGHLKANQLFVSLKYTV